MRHSLDFSPYLQRRDPAHLQGGGPSVRGHLQMVVIIIRTRVSSCGTFSPVRPGQAPDRRCQKNERQQGSARCARAGRGAGGRKEPGRGQERGRTADPSDATGPDQEGFREEMAVAEPAGVTCPGRARL